MKFEKLNACTDCLLLIANGDLDPDLGQEREREILAGFERRGYLFPGDSDEYNEFSWAPCEVCGTHLGGSRHEVLEQID